GGLSRFFYSFSGSFRQVVQEWCAAAVERLEIDRFIIRRAILPTPREDANPCACQGPHGRLGCLACIAMLLIIDLCPSGIARGCRRPLDKRWAEELGTLEAPVDQGRLAAAFRNRRQARLFLACVGGGQAFPLCAEGDEEAGSTHGPSPWQGIKHREVGRALSA